jgi:LCP family protein required for cell wall assembly
MRTEKTSEEEHLNFAVRSGAEQGTSLDSSIRRPETRAKFRWIRFLVAVLVLILVIAALYIGYIVNSVAKISTQPFQLSGLSTDLNGRVNVLVLGVGDPGHAGEDLSDTIMVLSLDTKTDRIAQISVPRDLRVDVPGYGYAKINAADAEGGVPLAEQTVSNTLGIPINYYVQTDFTGLSEIVNAIGGLDINVTSRLYDPDYPCANNQYKVCGVDIEPGLQHMNGAEVLEYVRCRKGTCGNDFGRAARQQQVMNLIRQKIISPSVIFDSAKLNPLVNDLHNGIKTDMNAIQIAEFAIYWQKAEKNQPINVVFSTSPGGYLEDIQGSTDLAPIGGDFTTIDNYVQNIFNPSSPD